MLDVPECVGECLGGTGSVGFDDPDGLNDIVPQILNILRKFDLSHLARQLCNL